MGSIFGRKSESHSLLSILRIKLQWLNQNKHNVVGLLWTGHRYPTSFCAALRMQMEVSSAAPNPHNGFSLLSIDSREMVCQHCTLTFLQQQ